jgi:TolB protein
LNGKLRKLKMNKTIDYLMRRGGGINIKRDVLMSAGILFFIIIASVTGVAQEKIRIQKSAVAKNPTLYFSGISGNRALSASLAKNLKNCGWFDIVVDPKANYVAGGSMVGTQLKVSLRRGSGALVTGFRIPVNGRDPDLTTRQAVDYLLNKVFGVKGLCTSKIAFCAEVKPGYKEIYTANYDGSGLKKITSNRSLSVEPAWEPGQKRLVYTMYSKMFTDIIEYDVASARSRRLIQFPGLNAGAAVSPDGRYFAVILSKDGTVDLYVKSINTKYMKRLTKGKSSESSPCWSPSGAKLCFVSDQSRSPKLYVIPVGGGNMTKLPTLGTESVSPDWSSDNKIIYSAKMGKHYAIALFDVKGKEPSRAITSAAGDWESPSWAPDNRHIVASRKFGGRSDIYVIDTWTGKAKRILAGKIPFSNPSW